MSCPPHVGRVEMRRNPTTGLWERRIVCRKCGDVMRDWKA